MSVLYENESVIFTATVADPDGPDDIQGGSLKSADEGLTYGAFQDVGNGTYEFTLSWAEIDQALGIEFEGAQQVDFKALFFDNEGHEASDSTSIGLSCGDEYSARACDGVCVVAKNDDDNCGECGNSCELGDQCVAGSCTVELNPECIQPAQSNFNTCSEYCGSLGEACTSTCGSAMAAVWAGDFDCPIPGDGVYGEQFCDSPLPFAENASLRCCCTVGALYPD